jgi:hypothetical protein
VAEFHALSRVPRDAAVISVRALEQQIREIGSPHNLCARVEGQPVPLPDRVTSVCCIVPCDTTKTEPDWRRTKALLCVVVLVTTHDDARTPVTVATITRTLPQYRGTRLKILRQPKTWLGFDAERSGVVVSVSNHFHWPGPDLCREPGKTVGTYAVCATSSVNTMKTWPSKSGPYRRPRRRGT